MTLSNIDTLETPEETGKRIKRLLENGSDLFLTRHRKKDGTFFDLEVSTAFMNIGQIVIVAFCRDITERKLAEQRVFNEKERLKTTLLSVGDGVISTDPLGNIQMMNPVAEKLTGWTQEDAYGKPFETVFQIINEITRQVCESPVKKVFKTGSIVELANQTLLVPKHGAEIPIDDSAAPIHDNQGNISGVVVVFRDYTEKKEKIGQIEYLSFRDHLTGLYNRRYIEDAIKRLDTARNLPFAIMALDINGLKLVNDAFGHEMGDQLLKTVADIVKNTCRSEDIIGRIGGDELCILLPCTDNQQAETIKGRVLQATSKAKLDSVVVSAAIGYAIKADVHQDIGGIYIEADNNMYKDKIKYGKAMRSQTIELVLRNINSKYDQEQIHTERVSQYCVAIAVAMDFNEKEIQDIKVAGVLHDIGKIIVPPDLLNKPSKLTAAEFEIVKKHVETGFQILKSVDQYSHLADATLHHHERWDGAGYPQGLKREQIPMYARIINVADAYEAMTARRPYQAPKSKEDAILELNRCAGTQFDPHIVKVFLEKVL